jgi:hypothetical protein
MSRSAESHAGSGAPPALGEAEALTSALLRGAGFSHAFFTRRGGASAPPWDTLNVAVSTGDDMAAVRENLERAARRLGVSAGRLYFLSQVHGTTARVLTGEEDREAVVREVGDITLSPVAGVACGARSADCAPVLIGDRRSGGGRAQRLAGNRAARRAGGRGGAAKAGRARCGSGCGDRTAYRGVLLPGGR